MRLVKVFPPSTNYFMAQVTALGSHSVLCSGKIQFLTRNGVTCALCTLEVFYINEPLLLLRLNTAGLLL